MGLCDLKPSMRTISPQQQNSVGTRRIGSALRTATRLPRANPTVAFRSGGRFWRLTGPTGKAWPREGAAAAEEDGLAEVFFATPCRPSEPEEYWEDLGGPPPMSPASRRGLYATVAIVVVSLLGMGTMTAYHQWMMPVPVELGMQTTAGPSQASDWPE